MVVLRRNLTGKKIAFQMDCIPIFRALVFFVVIPFGLGWNHNWEPYSEDGLPQLYAIEDYGQCYNQQGSYCKAEIYIRPNDENSTIALEIQKSYKYAYRLSRSGVYRMMCIPHEQSERKAVEHYVKKVMQEELRDYNITLEVSSYVCDVVRRFNGYDYLIITAVFLYTLLLCKSTMYDSKRRKNPNYPISKYHKWLMMFSILHNWDKAVGKLKNPDSEKLKCIQGMRFYSTIFVIICHTKLSLGLLFMDNPKDFEKAFANPWLYKGLQLDLLTVQIFFMISTLLLTNQIYELYKKHGSFSLGHCWNLYLNRIIRFLPTVGFQIIVTFPGLKLVPHGTMILDLIEMIWKGCVENWWSTILQVNYINKFKDMCFPGTWYISVDTVLYSTTIILLYIQLKFRLDVKKVLSLAFVATCINFGHVIYSNDLDIMYRLTAESARRFFDTPAFQMLYLSPYSSWSTGCVGIAVGSIFYHTKNKKFNLNKVLQIIWYLLFVLTPICVVGASLYSFEGIQIAIVGPLLKPVFAFAFGIGILGMSRGYGGYLKKIFEWDFAVKMSNFTFSTYVFHFFFVFSKGMFNSDLTHFTVTKLILFCAQDVIVSFVFGTLLTIIIEMPGLSLQKMYVPQIRKVKAAKTDQNSYKVD